MKQRIKKKYVQYKLNTLTDNIMPSSSADEAPTSKRKHKSKTTSITINRDSPKHANLSDYLEQNSQLTPKSSKESIFSADDITNDDEIFIIQCPKSISIEKLTDKKIKLNGKKTITEKNLIIEIDSSTFGDADINYSTLLCNTKMKKSDNVQSVSFKPAGFIKIQTRIDEICVPTLEKPPRTVVPYPNNLKVRHPIHGFNYENIIQISEKIKNRIQQAVQISNFTCKLEKNDDDEIKLNEKDNLKASPGKRLKKKRKTSIMDHLDDDKVKVKKSKKSTEIENKDSTNLDWLASI